MSSAKLNILLVEDNPGDARLIREMLQKAEGLGFTIDWVPRLSEALEKLSRREHDLVLLDLGLPDSRGLETFVQAYSHASQIPFVVLSGLDDETLALSAVREGAQDYLVKGKTDSNMLLRAIRYATERKRIEEELRLANEELESRVAARTAELCRTNENLLQEIFQRQQAERALQLAHDTLELKVAMRTAELAKANAEMYRENKVRQAAETALEAERQRLYALLDGLPAFVYLKAPDYSIKFANRLFREACGDWQGKKCYEAIFKTAAPCKNCTQFQVLETGKAIVKEATYAENNRMHQIYSYPFADVDGSSLILTLGIDISERKQAEEALRRQKAEQQIILDSVPAMIFYKDANNCFVSVNKACREITGFAAAQIEGKSAFEVFPNQAEDYFRDDLEVIRSGIAKRNIVEPQETTRGLRWLQTDKIPYRDDNDNIIGVIGFSLDITERKKAEEELRQSQARLAKAQRLACLGNWEWDLTSGEAIWSDEVYRIFGLTPESFTPSLEAIMALVHPEDEARVRKGLEVAMSGPNPVNFVNRIIRPDGSVRYVHSQAEAVFDAGGRPQRLLGTAQDITERRIAENLLRDSEARFRAIFESAALGIGLTDMEGRLLTTNKTFQKMLRYSEEELCQKLLTELTHDADLNQSLELFNDLKSGRLYNYQIEKRYRRKDGQYFWGRATVSPVKDSKGQPLYTIGMVEDITQEKEAGEKLQESEKSLRLLASQLMTAQEDERKRISKELHDELGQALLVLKLQTRSLEKQLQPEQENLRDECLEMLANIDQVVNNARRLSHDLSPLMLEDLGLSVALERLIGDFCKHFNIDYSCNNANVNDLFSPETQTGIYRIFQESLTNIGKYSQATGLMISITRNENYVSFRIQDNGKGFDLMQLRQRVAGMGLSAMKERVQMLGGTFSIWSREGEGTKITFNIPYTPWLQ